MNEEQIRNLMSSDVVKEALEAAIKERVESAVKSAIEEERSANPRNAFVEKPPKMEPPQIFKGNKAKTKDFIFIVENYLEYNKSKFYDDKVKISFVLSRFGDTLINWHRNLHNDNDPALESWDSYWSRFKSDWIDSKEEDTAAKQLARAMQGSKSIAEWEVYVQALGIKAGEKSSGVIRHFKRGLRSDLALAMVGKTGGLISLTDVAAVAKECEADLKEINDDSSKSVKKRNFPSDSDSNSNKFQKTHSGDDKANADKKSFPTKKAHVHIPDEVAAKRKEEKRCYKCGIVGHFGRACRTGFKVQESEKVSEGGNSSKQEMQANNKAVSFAYLPVKPILLVPITIEHNNIRTHCSALLDSGCSVYLIDSGFAKQIKLDEIPFKKGKEIKLVSGIGLESSNDQTVGHVSGVTLDTFLHMGHSNPQSHKEDISFGTTPLSGPYSVVLSNRWLGHHNPNIDWEKGRIEFTRCPESCSLPSTDEIVSVICIENTPNNSLSSFTDQQSIQFNAKIVTSGSPELPPQYADFADVFDEVACRRIPQYRAEFDAYIEFKDPTVLPRIRPIIPLNREKDVILKKWLDDDISKGYLRISKSQIAAPIFFVSKADGGWRPCIDYRDLNTLTKRIHTPLPLISELIDRLSGARIFTKIDLRSAYNQLRIRAGEEWKYSFKCKYGQFEPLVLGFGTTNAPSFFQHWMNSIFHDLLDECLVVYLDDICIFSKNPADHEKHVKEVLLRLRANNLYAKMSKCVFQAEEIELVGFIINKDGISMNPKKVAAVTEWKEPTSQLEVMSFLGFVGFYRRFIQNFSKIATPLTKLLRKEQKFSFGSVERAAFTDLQSAITRAPILRHVDMSLPFFLECDASDFAVGAVLLQQPKDSNFKHPVAFYSKKLVTSEVNYGVPDKELLAIVKAIRTWRHWLLCTPFQFTVFTDHYNLKYFRTKQILSSRHFGWAQELSEYDFVLIHKAGITNRIADLLSRRGDHAFKEGEKSEHNSGTLLPDKVWMTATHCTQILFDVNAVVNAVETNLINDESESNSSDDDAMEVEPYQANDNVIEITDEKEKLLITKIRHDSVLAGHFGIAKTLALIQRDFTWKGIRKYVKDYVSSCECKRNKVPNHKPFGLLARIPFAQRPWSQISLDFIVKLPISNGCDALLVVCDRGFTKGAHFVGTTESIDAKGIVELLFKNVFRYHGLPDNIISDRGPAFVSKVWKYVFQTLKTKISLSSAYHPETDGQTESTNAIWEQLIRNYVNYLQDDWEGYNHLLEIAYNNAVHSGLGCSPWFAQMGYNPRIDYLVLPTSEKSEANISQSLSNLKKVQENIKSILEEAQNEYKKYADRKRIPNPFVVGQMVYLNAKNIRTTRPKKKLDHKLLGPYKIAERINAEAWKLELPKELERIHPVFHSSLLEPYVENMIPNRILPPPPPVILADEEEYEVEDIVDSRIIRKKLEYRVRWKGYSGADEFNWQPAENLDNSKLLSDTFHTRYPNKPSPRNLQIIASRRSNRKK